MDKADRIILIRESIHRLKEDKSFLLEFPPLLGAIPTLLRVGMTVANVASKVGPALSRGVRIAKQVGGVVNKVKGALGGGGGGGEGSGSEGGGSEQSAPPSGASPPAELEQDSSEGPSPTKSGVQKQ